MSDDDLQSFLAEMGDVKPLENDTIGLSSGRDRVAQKQQIAALQLEEVAKNNPLSLEGVKPLHPDDYLEHQQPGIQDGVFKNLRMGKYPLEHKISIASMPLVEACNLFYQSLTKCHERGVRALVVHHGKGLNSKPFPAFKKSYVKHWLDELDMVIAYHTAQPQHGGLAATYVLLKKHPNQKLINREKNKRG